MSDERPTSDAAEDGPDGGGPPWSSEAGNSGERVSDADADAWAKACAEDLAEEKARRRAQHGPPPGSAAEELRRLVDVDLLDDAFPLVARDGEGLPDQDAFGLEQPVED